MFVIENLTTTVHKVLIKRDTLVLTLVTKLRQTLIIHITVVTKQLVALAYNSLRAKVRTAATSASFDWAQSGCWTVHSLAFDGLAFAVGVCLALGVAFEDVVATAIHAAS